MSMNVGDVERALLALNPQERAGVIHRALQSLDPEPTEVDQESVDARWLSELRQRMDAVESGAVELLDVDESHARLRAELADRRK